MAALEESVPKAEGSRPAVDLSQEVPENCRKEMPPLGEVNPNHLAAGWYPLEKGEKLQQAAQA